MQYMFATGCRRQKAKEPNQWETKMKQTSLPPPPRRAQRRKAKEPNQWETTMTETPLPFPPSTPLPPLRIIYFLRPVPQTENNRKQQMGNENEGNGVRRQPPRRNFNRQEAKEPNRFALDCYWVRINPRVYMPAI